MASELEIMGEVLHVRVELPSGRAEATVRRAGLTNTDVARLVGVSPASVSRWFSGQRRPRRGPALRLARLLRQLEVVNDAR